MKKVLALLIVALLVVGLVACGNGGTTTPVTLPATVPGTLTFDTVRLAFIHVGDAADRGYTYRQHHGTLYMMEVLGISEDQVLTFMNIPAGDQVDTSILEAIEWGADMIFATSFGHGPHMLEAAQQFPDVQFFHATGNLAVDSGLPNFHNYFGNMSQARYLSGIAAGLRTETNVLGFVAAHPNAEVITGLTAFFMGAQSVNPDVTMYVMYMNAWNNPTLEGQIAQALIDRGADVIAQHADSPTAQTVAEANGVWAVGYNNDQIPMAPNATLLSPMFNWSVYLIQAVRGVVEGTPVPADFLGDLTDGMVLLSPLNTYLVHPDTEHEIEEAKNLILGGWNVFTGPIYAADGTQILAPGEEWVERLSAPSWMYIIRGITVVE